MENRRKNATACAFAQALAAVALTSLPHSILAIRRLAVVILRKGRRSPSLIGRNGLLSRAFPARSADLVFKDTRLPVSVMLKKLEAGATIDEITDSFHITPP